MAIELGDRVRDKVTGVEGVVNGMSKWLTGCDRASVQPPMPKDSKDGKMPDSYWFDLHALVVVQKRAVVIDQPAANRDNGGPPTRSPR